MWRRVYLVVFIETEQLNQRLPPKETGGLVVKTVQTVG